MADTAAIVKSALEVMTWIATFWKPKKSSKHRKNVLIVEDNPDDANMLVRCLEMNGLSAVVSETAEGAKVLIARNSLSIAFIDMRLRHMDGWDLIPLIWALSPHTLVVVVCGELSDVSRISSIHFHPIIVMRKPPTVESIQYLLSHLKFE